MDYKAALSLVAIAIGIVGYVPYFRDIFGNKTKPHAFSWLVWGVLTAIAFAGQITANGGAGAWVTGFTALVCFVIFALALIKGTKEFPLTDWLCLAGCVISLILWALTNDPLTAIILVTIIDMLGFLPTFRKTYLQPQTETTFTYTMSGIKFFIAILALREYSVTTVLYPLSLVITNLVFVIMVKVRRTQLSKN